MSSNQKQSKYVGVSRFGYTDVMRFAVFVRRRTRLEHRYKVGRLHLKCTESELSDMTQMLSKEMQIHGMSFKLDTD